MGEARAAAHTPRMASNYITVIEGILGLGVAAAVLTIVKAVGDLL